MIKKKFLLFTSYGFIISFILLGFDAQGQLTPNFQCLSENVELEIYNGLYDWSSNTSFLGSSNGLPVLDKLIIGAVTIANKNDTDGDLVIDSNDSNGVVATTGGRNEIDLMKLIIKKNNPSITGLVTLRVIGNVSLWTSPLKIPGSNLSLLNDEISFSVNELNKTIYVEALEESIFLRDIRFELLYDGIIEDIAKATAFWVEKEIVYKTRGNDDFLTYVPNGLPNNPEVWTQLQFDGYNMQNHILSNRALDNSQFGFGPFESEDEEPDRDMGGRILFEFALKPTLVTEEEILMFDEFDINIDVGRSRKSYSYNYSLGSSNIGDADEEPWPLNLENCNNDAGNANDDEDVRLSVNSPNFFSFDTPSYPNVINLPRAYMIYESLFMEFVRLEFDYSIDPFDGDLDQVIGTRCSENIPWRIDITIKEALRPNLLPSDDQYAKSNHTFEVVNSQISYSYPRRTVGSGKGIIDIALMPSASSHGYELILSGNTWYLYQNFILVTSASSSSGEWSLLLNNELSIDIINDVSSPFTDGNIIYFNVFSSETPILNALESN